LIEKAKVDQNNERRMIALQLSAKSFFRQDKSEHFDVDVAMFGKLFDGMLNGIIEQSKKTVSLDLVLDRKGGRHAVV